MITGSMIETAYKRIQPFIVRTPLLRCPALDGDLGCQVYLKLENLQRTGSFKIRGALSRLTLLSETEKKKGVVCASSGNHAIALAMAAAEMGVASTVIMPETVHPYKHQLVSAYASQVLYTGKLSSERNAKAREMAEAGLTLVHSHADPHVIAGQGTIGIELLEDSAELDHVLIPVGGGGLISGISTVVKARQPAIQIVGVEPAGAPRYGLSRNEGSPVVLDTVQTIADGTRCDHANPDNFLMIENNVDILVTASEAAIKKAVGLLALKGKVVAEPSSSLPIAAILDGSYAVKSTERVAFVVTGGNIDPSLFTSLLQDA